MASKPPDPTPGEPGVPGILWTRWLPAIVTALAAVFATRRLDDFDTWWHLASGRWIVQHARVPHTDTLSYTVPDHAWTNLQWLYDVSLYALYRIGGADLLVIAAAIAFTAALWIVMRNAQLFVGPVVAAVLGLLALLVAEERFMIRPEMISFVLLGVVLRLLLTMRGDGGARLWLLPLLMVVWVNCHALFVVGLLCIACFGAGAIAARLGVLPGQWCSATDPGPAAIRRLTIFGSLSLVATVVNPYFLRGTFFPLALLSRMTGTGVFQVIGEFRRPFSGSLDTGQLGVFQVLFVVSIALSIVAAACGLMGPRSSGGRTREATVVGFDFGAALFFSALAYLSTLARRNIGLFAVGATPIIASWFALIADRWKITATLGRPRWRGVESLVGGGVVVASLALGLYVASNGYYRATDATREFGLGIFESNFPIRAAEFAAQVQLPPKLYNDLTAGGYLTWKAPVEGGVFIDGRLEVYDKDFVTQYTAALNDPSAWQRQAASFGVSTVLLFHRWPNRHPLIASLARDPRWELIYYDETAVLFVRREGNAEAIARAHAAFPEWDARTRQRLAAPPQVWGAPVERATALDSYASLALTLGNYDRALEAWQRLLDLGGMNTAEEASLRYRVAWLLANKGERADARRHAEIAMKLAPGDANIRRLLASLGG